VIVQGLNPDADPLLATRVLRWLPKHYCAEDDPELRSASQKVVAQVFASIMQERHPGSRWLPAHLPERNTAPRPGQLEGVIASPDDLDPVLDLSRPTT
jgi:hypothetical protein